MFDKGAREPGGSGGSGAPGGSPFAGCALGPDGMTVLAGIEPAGLPVCWQQDLVAAWAAQGGWVAAQRLRALAVLVRTDRGPQGSLCASVAAQLAISESAADKQIALALALTERFPATLEALAAGRISERHAAILVDELGLLPDERQDPALETDLLGCATSEAPAAFRRHAHALVIAADPGRAVEDAHAARAARGVSLRPELHGMAGVHAFLPGEQASRLMSALTAAADADYGGRADCRTLTARRADALVRWADDYLTGAPPTTGTSLDCQAPAPVTGRPGKGRGRPRLLDTVGVIIDLPTLLGLADHPAQLPGYGPLPADIARHLAADASWRRLVTDPVTGHLLDYGRTTYRPPTDLARFITSRDHNCRFPGCSQPSWRCDQDHLIPFAAGGTTAAHQMIALCRHHHALKHDGNWQVSGNANHTITWTSPTGRTYITSPTQLPTPAFTYHFHNPPPPDPDRTKAAGGKPRPAKRRPTPFDTADTNFPDEPPF